jgi:CheY-like chemotaxis protein
MDVPAYTVLTIEDEELIRDSFRFYLEDCGYKVL